MQVLHKPRYGYNEVALDGELLHVYGDHIHLLTKKRVRVNGKQIQGYTAIPKDARDNYTCYLEANGAGWTASFSTMMMGDPQHYVDRARTQYSRAAEARGTFGSYEAALEPTKADQLTEMVCSNIYDDDFG